MPAVSPTDLRAEIVTDFSRLEAVAGDWERLRAAGPRPEAFQTFGWARASWRTLEQGRTLASVVVSAGTEVVGLLPLTLDGQTLSFLASRQSDYNDLLAEPASAAAVLESAVDALLGPDAPAWRHCTLQNVPADSNLAVSLRSLPRRLRAHFTSGWYIPCPTLVIEGDREEVLRPLIGKSSLKRRQKKLGRRGEVTFRHIEDREEARSHLPTFFQQHIRRRAMAHDVSQMLQPEQRAFYEALVEELDPASTLRFGVLELDGRPIAYHFGFQSDRKFIWYKPAFDVDLWDDGPGEVLVRQLLIYCQTADVGELDFTIGAVGFKSRFANRVRFNQTVTFHRSVAPALARRPMVASRDFIVGRPRVRAWFRDGRARADRVLALRHRSGPPQQDRIVVPAPSAEATLVREGGLGDLADLSVVYPREVSGDDLHRARRRFKDGNRLFLGTQGEEVTQFAWLGEQGIDDHWVAPPRRGDEADFLRRVAERVR